MIWSRDIIIIDTNDGCTQRFFYDDKHKTTITNNLSLSFFWPHQNHSKMIKKITFIHTLLLLLLTVKLLLHFHTFLLTVSLFECARALRGRAFKCYAVILLFLMQSTLSHSTFMSCECNKKATTSRINVTHKKIT